MIDREFKITKMDILASILPEFIISGEEFFHFRRKNHIASAAD